MKSKVACASYLVLTTLLLICGYLFETPFGNRGYLLAIFLLLYLLNLILHFILKKPVLQTLALLGMILLLVGLEFLSKYAVNYFYHSLYLLLLLLIIFRCERKRGLSLGILLSLCSFIKFAELLIIQPSTGNIAMSVFFATTQLLLLLVFYLYRVFREESVRNKELYEELLVTNLQLKQYSEEMKYLTKLQERSNIARDLHDTLGHELTGLIMQMEMASRLMEQAPAKGQSILEEAKVSARGSLSQVRAIVDTLKSDEEISWNQTSIKELIEHFSAMTGVQITYESRGDDSGNKINGASPTIGVSPMTGSDPAIGSVPTVSSGPASGLSPVIGLSPTIGLTLYRLVQEALTNAVRHGKATKVTIRIDYQQNKVCFELFDNGKGCMNMNPGNGIKGMLERVSALHGALEFNGSKGFHITGFIPY
jgi:signal transduction histidine kinase